MHYSMMGMIPLNFTWKFKFYLNPHNIIPDCYILIKIVNMQLILNIETLYFKLAFVFKLMKTDWIKFQNHFEILKMQDTIHYIGNKASQE